MFSRHKQRALVAFGRFGVPAYTSAGTLGRRGNGGGGQVRPFDGFVYDTCKAEVSVQPTWQPTRACLLPDPTLEDFYSQGVPVLTWAPERMFRERRLQYSSACPNAANPLMCPICEKKGGVQSDGWRPTPHQVVTLTGRMLVVESGFKCVLCKAEGRQSSWGSAKGGLAAKFLQLNFHQCIIQELPVVWVDNNDTYGWHRDVVHAMRILTGKGVSIAAFTDFLNEMQVSCTALPSLIQYFSLLEQKFNTPQDKILWDVGHQSYPHKILTGRRGKMPTMRQTNGLSGFTKRGESEHDCFGTGHSSTTISAGLGMAVGRDLKGKNNNVVAVIGDGAMTAGQAYEAMNNAGYLDSDMIVILNDNKQVSLPTATLDGPSPPVGALSSALSRLQSNPALRELREVAKGMTKQIGGPMHQLAAKVDEYARGMISGTGSSLFEELGLYYIGPVDGHNIDDLVAILKEVKSTRTTGPVLIHVVTEKGRGYPYAERADDKYHGVVKFDPATGRQFKTTNKTQSYTTYFAEALVAEAEVDKDVVAIHAAMGGGTGLNLFQRRFPTRCFDVGIAEQHAVTFAAGLACEGLKPFCAIYSSFMQRAYDQVVHDVDLQKLPVRFAMDRAGLVGADGPTHCGAFDVTFMACLPNMIVMAPSDEADLFNMVATAVAIDDRPSCFRYPRGNGIGVALPPGNKGVPIEIGKGRILKEGERVALLGYGSAVQSCLGAAVMLEERGLNVTVADARFCKPLDRALIRSLAKSHEVLITVEEGSIGGFGSHVVQFLALDGLLDGKLKWRPMVLPDRYIDHGAPADQLAEAGLMPSHIAATALNLIGAPREALF